MKSHAEIYFPIIYFEGGHVYDNSMARTTPSAVDVYSSAEVFSGVKSFVRCRYHETLSLGPSKLQSSVFPNAVL
jgi:hypothetical protein